MRRASAPHRMLRGIGLSTLLGWLLAVSAAAAAVDPSGTLALPTGSIPFSELASDEARKQFIESLTNPSTPPPGSSIEATRRFYDEFNSSLVDRMRKRYAVSVKSETIGGVVTDVVTPAQGISSENQARVLINLHGGAFMWGAHSGGLVESIPIAVVGKIKVITVDYRMAPENHFPAAGADVAAVYGALLKTYRPSNIGIYGCSAGGFLTAESVAGFHAKGLPTPGAIGTFCASVVDIKGDSSFIAPILDGQLFSEKPFSILDLPYFKELHVYEGMWHAFFIYPELPESIAVYSVIVQFFERHLGR